MIFSKDRFNRRRVPTVPCVYCITNLINNKEYIGSTSNARLRLNSHYDALKKKTTHCPEMLQDFMDGNIFEFEILYVPARIDSRATEICKRVEAWFIIKNNTVDNGYNKSYNYTNEKSLKTKPLSPNSADRLFVV